MSSAPADDLISNVPPSAAARSLMPISPKPFVFVVRLKPVRCRGCRVRLAKVPQGIFNAVHDALETEFALDGDPSQPLPTNYVAWFDGPGPAHLCGEAGI